MAKLNNHNEWINKVQKIGVARLYLTKTNSIGDEINLF